MTRFLADAMVARLARWLRVLAYDTAYAPTLDDHALVALAAAEDRVLLTRDRHLLRELRPTRALEIRSDVPLEQLRAVAGCRAPCGAVPAAAASTGPARTCDACVRRWRGRCRSGSDDSGFVQVEPQIAKISKISSLDHEPSTQRIFEIFAICDSSRSPSDRA